MKGQMRAFMIIFVDMTHLHVMRVQLRVISAWKHFELIMVKSCQLKGLINPFLANGTQSCRSIRYQYLNAFNILITDQVLLYLSLILWKRELMLELKFWTKIVLRLRDIGMLQTTLKIVDLSYMLPRLDRDIISFLTQQEI